MNPKETKDKILNSINYIKNSEKELKFCFGDSDSVTITDDSSLILLKREELDNFKKCTTELQKSIGFLHYAVWQKYCNYSSYYDKIIHELSKNNQFHFKVYKNGTNSALFSLTFKILGKNSYTLQFQEIIEDDKEQYASTYCKDNYLKELGLYDEFSAELNEPLYGHDGGL